MIVLCFKLRVLGQMGSGARRLREPAIRFVSEATLPGQGAGFCATQKMARRDGEGQVSTTQAVVAAAQVNLGTYNFRLWAGEGDVE
jgi:hypothetical protein